jgi:hypothetical protein
MSYLLLFKIVSHVLHNLLRIINEEDDELDDELEMVSIILIGQYRKRRRLESIGHQSSVIGHEVHNQQRQDYDMRLYWDYFFERPTYPGNFFMRRF